MRSEVNVRLDAATAFSFDLDEVQPMPHDVARWWLDEQFTLLGCEPLRPTGKVLIADKVVCVAQAAGETKFRDAAWSGLLLARFRLHLQVRRILVLRFPPLRPRLPHAEDELRAPLRRSFAPDRFPAHVRPR